jgi:CRISPR/Cas system CSM-associated protein Csm2 small subunit
MSDFFKNGIVQGVFATLIGVLILGILGWLKFKRDEKIVTKVLKNIGAETSHTHRTTHAISSATNLSEERIRKVCSKSSMIRRNQKEKESWKLS